MAQYKDEPAFFKSSDDELFNGSPKKQRKKYIAASPITYCRKLTSPLLVLHGKNDSRCPARQMKNFLNTLDKYSKPFDVLWYDSGHLGNISNQSIQKAISKTIFKFLTKISKIKVSKIIRQ